MMLNHLSRSNVRQHGIEILGEAVVKGEHTFYMIVQAPTKRRLQRSCSRSRGSERPRFTRHRRARKVITSGGCTVEAPASSPDVMDPEEACSGPSRPAWSCTARTRSTAKHRSRHSLVASSCRARALRSQPFPYADAQSVHVAATGGGLTDRRLTLSLRDLQAMPSQTQVVALECAGDNRARLSPPVDGEQWRLGTDEHRGSGRVYRWSRCSIRPGSRRVPASWCSTAPTPEAMPGKPEKIHFERGLGIAEAGDSNAMLAYAMNGEPLPRSSTAIRYASSYLDGTASFR